MSDESRTESIARELERATDDIQIGSRRGFLQLGALVVTGLATACASDAASDGGAGTGNTPGAGGRGAAGAPGAGGTPAAGAGAPGAAGTNPGAGAPGASGAPGAAGTTAGGGTSPGGGAPGTAGASGGSTAAAGAGGGGSTSVGGWKENNFTPLPALPANGITANIPKLPDPFKFIDGTRIGSKADWEKLRADLSAMLQASVYGTKPPAPDMLTATFSGGTVTVNMTVGSKTGSFTFKITGGGTAAAPVPCVITCNGSSLPIPSGIATITLNSDTFAKQDKSIPTNGLVTTLYGSAAASAGSDICWAWGASRIIDALEKLPEAGINTKAIGVTGCSYAGKGALCMGAFDERVALTMMQEGGSGGSALWRVSTAEAAAGQNIQEATEIVGEQNWQGQPFKTLFNGQPKKTAPVQKLLADQHFTVALCAPRAVLLIENDIDWLGPVAAYGGGVAAREVFTALGIKDRIGISVAANHGHCSFPSSQQAALTAFITRFLKKGTADTSGVDVFNGTNSTLKTFKPADWIDWTTPTLAGALTWDPFA
ncbi:MAG: dockerin-like protein [Pseudomonadota bacterium]